MGIFDIFGTQDQQNAAQAQITGLQQGNAQATANINQGNQALQTNYTSALQPYLQNQQTANAGTTQLGNVLGLNGAQGNATAMQALQATPGYQFEQQQGNAAITAQDAATGKTGSGNEALALSNYNQGLASTTYNNYVSQLQPYLGAQQNAATGIANTYTGLGSGLNANQNNLAGLNFQTQTGIGNANANADLAGLTASGNIMSLLGSLGGSALGALGGSGGGIPGAIGPTSVGGAPLSGGGGLGSILSSIFSDERLKEDISKVGELTDGQPVYKYRYIGDNVFRIGLMAQDVEQTHPEAVTEIGGFKAVDYGRATQYASDLSRFLEAA